MGTLSAQASLSTTQMRSISFTQFFSEVLWDRAVELPFDLTVEPCLDRALGIRSFIMVRCFVAEYALDLFRPCAVIHVLVIRFCFGSGKSTFSTKPSDALATAWFASIPSTLAMPEQDTSPLPRTSANPITCVWQSNSRQFGMQEFDTLTANMPTITNGYSCLASVTTRKAGKAYDQHVQSTFY